MTPALLTKNTETVEYNATRNNFFRFFCKLCEIFQEEMDIQIIQ